MGERRQLRIGDRWRSPQLPALPGRLADYRIHIELWRLAGEPVLFNLFHRPIQVLPVLGVPAANTALYFRYRLHSSARSATRNATVPRRGKSDLPAAVCDSQDRGISLLKKFTHPGPQGSGFFLIFESVAREGVARSAGLTLRAWFASLPRCGLGRQGTDRQIDGPAIGENLPRASRLSHQNNQIFPALLAPLTHGDRHQHFATPQIDGDLAQHFQPERFHLHVAQSGFKQRNQKLPYRRQTANRRNIGADEGRVRGIELDQVVDMLVVAGLRPALDYLACARLGAPAG